MTRFYYGEDHPQYKHVMTCSAEVYAYQSMMQRCYNQKCKAYKNYGGRGITVCESWRKSCENFLKDVGLRPSAKNSLDRRDNNGNYDPQNVRWATRDQQANNRRSNRVVVYHGIKMTFAQAVRFSRGGVTR